ncbi:MAG: hypothetical protein HOP19_08515 [Acidobacteria bacterium]|nr:hypothetical protein [Acidobacteriota bacterium]
MVNQFIQGRPPKNDKLSEGNEELKKEIDLLPQIADLAKVGTMEVLQHLETIMEAAGKRRMGSASGKFYGAPMTMADNPIPYGRTLYSPYHSPLQLAFDFFKDIEHPRFKALQKMANAKPDSKKYLQQLRDAFYIWCAEHNNCDYFLTLDFKLIKMINSNKRHTTSVKLVKPSELLLALGVSAK